MKKKEISDYFIQRLGWHNIDGMPGHFSVSPDFNSCFIRVFSADIKVRNDGLSLLGSIGVHLRDDNCNIKSQMGLSAYITNLPLFYKVPIITSENDLSLWIEKISLAIFSLPLTKKDILRNIENGCVGLFPLRDIIESNPWFYDFRDRLINSS